MAPKLVALLAVGLAILGTAATVAGNSDTALQQQEGQESSRHTAEEQDETQRKLDLCSAGMTWKSESGRVKLNGEQFHIKGANWFGFETESHVLHGLWGATTMERVLNFCQANKINALRVPVSLDLALNSKTVVTPGSCQECSAELAWDMLDRLFVMAAARGIVIVLDMHRLDQYNNSDLWYDGKHTQDQFIQGWGDLLTRFGDKANLMGIDLKNEPHGAATWGLGSGTDWNAAAVYIVKKIKERVPGYNKLIFVEGVGTDGAIAQYPPSDPAFDKFWGQNLDGVISHPIDFGTPELNSLLVYSPHVYGPSVADQVYFKDATFPANMPSIWDKQVGFVEDATGKALVTGAWGGSYAGQDKLWQDAWADYMIDRCIADNFVWALNPNSGSNGGLLEADWSTPVMTKLQLLAKIQPNPSVFTSAINSSVVCVNYGAPANSKCALKAPGSPAGSKPDAKPHDAPKQPISGWAKPWAQCAGVSFGPDVGCQSGFKCEFVNDYYSQCQPINAEGQANGPSVSGGLKDDKCADMGAQCGGENWAGPRCCAKGSTCKPQTAAYSACVTTQAGDEAAADITDVTAVTDADAALTGMSATAAKGGAKCAKAKGQCGGQFWMGPKCCPTNYDCVAQETYFHQCLLKGTYDMYPDPVPDNPPYSGPCAGAYKQCGGKIWDGAKCCTDGNVCQYLYEWFSQCIPAAAIQGTVDWWDQCGGKYYKGKNLCRPGSVCQLRNTYFSQCEPTAGVPGIGDISQLDELNQQGDQPSFDQAADTADADMNTLENAADKPAAPVIVKTWGQCGGEGYKGPNTCEEGSTCEYNNAAYSQCLPVSKVDGDARRYHWEQCGGFGYKGSTSCVEGWACAYVNDWYHQCMPIGHAQNAN